VVVVAYIGGEYILPEAHMAAIRRMTGGTPATTLYNKANASVTNTSYATKKTWTVAGDGACLVVYRIDPDNSDSSASARLRVQVNSSTLVEMTTNGTETGDNFLVGLAFDDNHQNNVDCLFFTNGDVVNLDAYKSAGTVYVDWLYFEYDLN
jgi:hypothetical protein